MQDKQYAGRGYYQTWTNNFTTLRDCVIIPSLTLTKEKMATNPAIMRGVAIFPLKTICAIFFLLLFWCFL